MRIDVELFRGSAEDGGFNHDGQHNNQACGTAATDKLQFRERDHLFRSPQQRTLQAGQQLPEWRQIHGRQVVGAARCIRNSEVKIPLPSGEAQAAADPVPDRQHRSEVLIQVTVFNGMMDLVLRRRNQHMLEDAAIGNPDMGVAQVRPRDIECEQNHVRPEHGHQFDAIAQEKEESGHRGRLDEDGPQGEEGAFNGMCSVNRKGGQGLGRMVNLVEAPENWPGVQTPVNEVLGTVVQQEEPESEESGDHPVRRLCQEHRTPAEPCVHGPEQ